MAGRSDRVPAPMLALGDRDHIKRSSRGRARRRSRTRGLGRATATGALLLALILTAAGCSAKQGQNADVIVGK
jgi:uncharacterized protein HemX